MDNDEIENGEEAGEVEVNQEDQSANAGQSDQAPPPIIFWGIEPDELYFY